MGLQDGYEDSVQPVQYWPRPFAFEDGDLLSQRKDFEGDIAAISEEHSDGEEKRRDENKHGNQGLTRLTSDLLARRHSRGSC